MTIASIGPIMQIAFVPPDFDAALKHWTEVMGAGPFFLLEGIRLEEATYRGEPSHCVMTGAIGYWGDMQVELIRQDNDAPSIYRDMANNGALHHVCLVTDDLAKAKATVLAAGGEMLFEAKVGANGAVFYADAKGFPGSIVEVLQPPSGTMEAFAMMREAARDWDGREPVRRLG